MEYSGGSKRTRIEITLPDGWLKSYVGQRCDGIVYDDGHCQIYSEQLSPPVPSMQSVRAGSFKEVA